MRGKYKRVTDLYVQGTEVELADDTALWMQALNPFERDEALHDAQVARARLVMALKENGEEAVKIKARIAEQGRQAIIDEVAEARASRKLPEILGAIQDDPDWKERLDILARTDETQSATPLTDEERVLLVNIESAYVDEVTTREKDEREFQVRTLSRSSEEDLEAAYLELWLENRGTAVASNEYSLTEIWYGARVCEGVKSDGVWNHDACNGHTERVFDDKAEVRALPEAFQAVLHEAVGRLAISVREAKNSDRQASSYDSSRLPSAEAESTPSIPSETPVGVPGTSPSQSAMA